MKKRVSAQPSSNTTNTFKACRREVISGYRPLISPHFNITVELPLKAIVRGYSWTSIPITYRSRQTGKPKLKIKEMGSRYTFSWLTVWLEKHLTRGDYHRRRSRAGRARHSGARRDKVRNERRAEDCPALPDVTL